MSEDERETTQDDWTGAKTVQAAWDRSPLLTSLRDHIASWQVTQTILTTPEMNEAGVYGNCIQAAVASLLGRPLDAVPHFGAFAQWRHALSLWAEGEGFRVEQYDAEFPADRCIYLGPSPRGYQHAVVGAAGRIVWDPHPSRGGLTSIDYALRIYRSPTHCARGLSGACMEPCLPGCPSIVEFDDPRPPGPLAGS